MLCFHHVQRAVVKPMLNIDEVSVIIYFIVALVVIGFGTKLSQPGPVRVFVFATLLSVFFSMGLLVGHGALPFPGLWILGSCWHTDSCSRMYGDAKGLFLFVLGPMFVQWIIVLLASFGLYYVAKRTGFDQSVPIVMGEKAIKHRRIIGIGWLVVGAAGLLLSVYSILQIPLNVRHPGTILALIPGATVPLLFICGGYSLLRNFSWSRWLCLPSSVLAMLAFPVGTVLGGYYLWYYLTIEKQT